ncbi:hypothetical protein DVH24_002183 [Malus domestica]|uniref:Uncharacterized protein n=1 Tax=Malus domestica TaxID=3750 RepID=A0A498I9E2_MALDO|nr:hypothetical protein DVH24_002183 [Malus domestica]
MNQARSIRYYELGPDNPPYADKFYDFCGAEVPEASSCTTNWNGCNLSTPKIEKFSEDFENGCVIYVSNWWSMSYDSEKRRG